MSVETENIIEKAVREAEGTGDADGDLDTGTVPATDDTPEVVASAGDAAGDAGGADPAAPAAVSPTAGTTADTAAPVAVAKPADDLTKELEALGLKAPEAGVRENRLPYSRVKKIVENSRKKLTDAHTTALKERDDQLTKANERLKNMDAVDKLIATDPDRYLAMLGMLHPVYKKYTSAPVATPPAPVAAPDPAAALGERPAPDVKFEDGSFGYSPKQHEKLLDWVASTAEARAVARAEKSYTERFGPIEQQYKSQQQIEKTRPKVNAQVAWGKQTWGKLFEDDYALDGKSEVLAYMKANPGVPFEACVSAVLLPKVQVERTRMRSDILAEINARPKAAVKAAPTATKPSADTTPRTTQEIVAAAVAAAGLK
jgi:hypothetical protein